jgi:hypothetical protein
MKIIDRAGMNDRRRSGPSRVDVATVARGRDTSTPGAFEGGINRRHAFIPA